MNSNNSPACQVSSPTSRPCAVGPAHKILIVVAILFGAITASHAATGLEWIDANTNLTIYADLRLRYEADWDSQNAAGVMRDDRQRGRRKWLDWCLRQSTPSQWRHGWR